MSTANLLPVSLTPVANLPLVSTTLAVLVTNLPPVSLIPVGHLDLQISPRILEKIRNDPNAIIRGFGEDDSQKNQEQKACDTISLREGGLARLIGSSFKKGCVNVYTALLLNCRVLLLLN